MLNHAPYKPRHYCIFDEHALRNLPWRRYATERNAVNACLTLLYWLELGNTYTVWDERTGHVLKQFTRRVLGLVELEPDEQRAGPDEEMEL